MWACVFAVIPFSHRRSANRWLSNHQGLLFHTHAIWLSNENLNWKIPSPNSTILKSSPNFHIDRIRFFATLKLMDFDVRKHPIKLRENSSNILSLLTGRIAMTSSSSVVSFILWIRSSTSVSILMSHT